MRDPCLIPQGIRDRLASSDLWDIDPINLYRINWHNEPKEKGGGFGAVNSLEIPTEITGVPARIIGLVGKRFPTGSHKVGATYACLVPRLATGQFDPSTQKAVWPSTGNYLWHYHDTGLAMEEVALAHMTGNDRLSSLVFATGSAGTIASGDYIKEKFPRAKIVAAEALQCPTLLKNGFGAHRVEGIGDKHIP